MPYLSQAAKDVIDTELIRVFQAVAELQAPEQGTAGLTNEAVMNYVICEMFLEWFKGGYTQQAHGLGAIEAAKLELYRRSLAPYEDLCIKRNGDIFTDVQTGADNPIYAAPESYGGTAADDTESDEGA